MTEKAKSDELMPTRVDYRKNHTLIKKAYVTLIAKDGGEFGCPSISDIAKETGLNYSTVQRHYENITFEPKRHPLRALTDDVLLAIARGAIAGVPASQKLWMQVMEGWNPNAIGDGEEADEAQTIPNLIDGRTLMDKVIIDIAIEQGKDVWEVTRQLSLGAHKDSIEEAEIVEEGLQKPYDWDTIEKKHRKATKKEVAVKPSNGKGNVSDVGEELRAKIRERLEKGAVLDALKSVKDKNKRSGSNGQANENKV